LRVGVVQIIESDLIRLRTREGMKVAKAKGRLRGKQPKLKPNQAKHLLELHDSGNYTQAELGELLGVGRSTIYRTIDRMRSNHSNPSDRARTSLCRRRRTRSSALRGISAERLMRRQSRLLRQVPPALEATTDASRRQREGDPGNLLMQRVKTHDATTPSRGSHTRRTCGGSHSRGHSRSSS
jgi:hypothetical protein